MNDGEIKCVDLFKIYNAGLPNECRALNGVNLTIEHGEFASIVGPSGSGKSTLLNLLSVLDSPTHGEVFIEGVGISTLNGNAKAKFRRERLGFVFQQFNLIGSMTSAENIELPMRFMGLSEAKRKKRVADLLELVDLGDKGDNRPSELSGGQQQRIAVARGLANDPQIIMADEPTGNLDQKTGEQIMNMLKTLNKEEGKTLVLVTHDPKIAKNAPRTIRIVDGKVAVN